MKTNFCTAIAMIVLGLQVQAQWTRVAPYIYPTTITDNVGIGTTAPLSPLSFGTGLNNTKISLYESGATKLGLGYQAAQFRLHLDASTSRYSFLDAPAGNEILTVKGTGMVGIGINSPTSPLSFGSGVNNTKIALYENGAFKLGFGIQADQFRLHLDASTSRFSFLNAPAGTEILTIKGTGNVGIGTNNPLSTLELYSTSSPTMTVRTTLGADQTYFQSSVASSAFAYSNIAKPLDVVLRNSSSTATSDFIITNQSSNIIFATGVGNDAERMRITSSGIVQIGTSCTTLPAGGLLGVNGTIYAKCVKVELPVGNCFPDFVFAKNYKLTPLNELETFIKLNHHLPEIPTAEEVETNGINLAEMDVKLLKKIEELTLYIIEMNKESIEIKEENKEIIEHNKKLQEKIDSLIGK